MQGCHFCGVSHPRDRCCCQRPCSLNRTADGHLVLACARRLCPYVVPAKRFCSPDNPRLCCGLRHETIAALYGAGPQGNLSPEQLLRNTDAYPDDFLVARLPELALARQVRQVTALVAALFCPSSALLIRPVTGCFAPAPPPTPRFLQAGLQATATYCNTLGPVPAFVAESACVRSALCWGVLPEGASPGDLCRACQQLDVPRLQALAGSSAIRTADAQQRGQARFPGADPDLAGSCELRARLKAALSALSISEADVRALKDKIQRRDTRISSLQARATDAARGSRIHEVAALLDQALTAGSCAGPHGGRAAVPE
jgi:hypothetical protein